MDEKKNFTEAEREIIDIYGFDPVELYGVPEEFEYDNFYEDDYVFDLEEQQKSRDRKQCVGCAMDNDAQSREPLGVWWGI